jgi:hypothetical protein
MNVPGYMPVLAQCPARPPCFDCILCPLILPVQPCICDHPPSITLQSLVTFHASLKAVYKFDIEKIEIYTDRSLGWIVHGIMERNDR